jgi:uncharacterized protein (DUF2384 family)
MIVATVRTPHVSTRQRRKSLARDVDWERLDAVVLSTLEDRALHRSLRRLDKLELADIRPLAERVLSRQKLANPQVIAPRALHERLMHGLSGESLLVSASLFLDTLQEAERFFHFSFKTIKARLGRALDTSSSELVLRGGRATTAAAELFGGFDAARRYLRTKNYALGGAIPLELLKTAEGERLVMNELHAQAEGGPL